MLYFRNKSTLLLIMWLKKILIKVLFITIFLNFRVKFIYYQEIIWFY